MTLDDDRALAGNNRMDLVALDVGGTQARFALASTGAAGVVELGEPIAFKTSDYVSLQTAWEAFERHLGATAPRNASIAIAGPVTGEVVRMTNNSWVLNTGALDEQLGLDRVTVLNDFGAVAHAVARAPKDQLVHITGPDIPLPDSGTVSVIGPGTGLGVAHFQLVRPSKVSCFLARMLRSAPERFDVDQNRRTIPARPPSVDDRSAATHGELYCSGSSQTVVPR